MNCIFCHNNSDNSKSIEHIVPESLGNKHTVLWRGAVCDKCNNYFATKIEKELLQQPYFVSARRRNIIKTKKGRSVQQEVFLVNKKGQHVPAMFDYDGHHGNIYLRDIKDVDSLIKGGRVVEPIILEPEANNYILSRFLAKCAFEYLVYRTKEENFCEFSEYLKDEQFELLRKYARYGEGCKFWPYSQRRIYGEGDQFKDLSSNKSYERLNEMDFLSIELDRKIENGDEYLILELYYVLVILGIEYVIHIGEPDISGYHKWLQKNNYKSPVESIEDIRIPNEYEDIPLITEKLIRKLKK
ncbi:MAG TPA: hypothetical protein DDW85_10450 [Porphyromonadaceae bacterium]|nr:hypothetical protein [Porphyromonadaceae bacterium]